MQNAAQAWNYQERGWVLMILPLPLPNDIILLGLSYASHYQLIRTQ